jgi:hypothetical protein
METTAVKVVTESLEINKCDGSVPPTLKYRVMACRGADDLKQVNMNSEFAAR